jgi:ABC-2 type transport system permease protein
MLNYIKAENLKCKGTFAKKLVVIAPVCMVLLSTIEGKYFVVNGYNWWYALILPGFVTLLTTLVNQNEEKKLHYRAVFALPVNLKKTWISKASLIGIYVAIANIIHLAGIILGKLFYCTSSNITISQMITATLLLIVTSLWQIPFCLFFAKKFGLLPAVLINFGAGTALCFFAVTKSFWWICPYSWAARLMCPVMGILPNGNPALHGDALLDPGVVPIGIILSIALFVVLLAVTANWFSKQEVK